MLEFKLGSKAKDKITAFEGILTAKVVYLYGCSQYCISPQVLSDGKMLDGNYFDEGRIEIIGNGILPEEVKGSSNGGSNRDCPKR